MTTIWKYPLAFDVKKTTVTLEMPEGAEILCLQLQDVQPTLWARVDPSQPKESREFVIVGTGWPNTPDPMESDWVGTFQVNGGDLVFHVFELLEKSR